MVLQRQYLPITRTISMNKTRKQSKLGKHCMSIRFLCEMKNSALLKIDQNTV